MALEISAPLLAWYDRNARDLPWRHDPTPYRVWVSEVMLQQTRVQAVLAYYDRFVEALPDISVLADASEAELMKLWEGLGYYGRARNMQMAARKVMERYGGELPRGVMELRKLPGFGDYIAGAVASIAFGLPAEAVDGNALRVLSRLTASREDIGNPGVMRRFRELARGMLPPGRPGAFNQALMDLGATVCVTGASPRCDACPLRPRCAGFAAGLQGSLPVKSPKKPRAVYELTVFVLADGGRSLLVKRPAKGLLAGLWGLPMAGGWLDGKDAAGWLRCRGAAVSSMRRLEDAKHAFTHAEWRMRAWRAEVAGFEPEGEHAWVSADELMDFAVPRAFKAYAKYLGTTSLE